ncbi:unnamed protein product [Prorocentrum cordatum]|uniref:Uncharacterized protein n=1 Tax=Prorocentrum cordatum TaxID=2364126 RepID=A0ABN9V4E2_9DINO|nr:unnamed protein product [Polarella glacialis]
MLAQARAMCGSGVGVPEAHASHSCTPCCTRQLPAGASGLGGGRPAAEPGPRSGEGPCGMLWRCLPHGGARACRRSTRATCPRGPHAGHGGRGVCRRCCRAAAALDGGSSTSPSTDARYRQADS